MQEMIEDRLAPLDEALVAAVAFAEAEACSEAEQDYLAEAAVEIHHSLAGGCKEPVFQTDS